MSESVSPAASSPPNHDARDALELVHHHPGRIRVRAEALRVHGKSGGNGRKNGHDHGQGHGHAESREDAHEDEEADDVRALAARIQAGMEAMPGISRLAHNARTGSLLVEYEPGLCEPDAIITRIAQIAGLLSPFDPRVKNLTPPSPAQAAISATRELNAVVYELTGWRTDLRFIAPAALAALSAYSFAFNKREPRLPRWDNLLYWSYNIFSALHQREIVRAGSTENASIEGGALERNAIERAEKSGEKGKNGRNGEGSDP